MMTRLDLLESHPPTKPRIRYVTQLHSLRQLPAREREQLKAVADVYPFRANDYYLGLIDWDDPDDPIRQLVIPRGEELCGEGTLDVSNEAAYTILRGVQHKYPDTVVLLCNEVCGAYCRYCFRKRLFMDGNDETAGDISGGLSYIAAHPEVTNVLLSGGDPLLMSTRRIAAMLEALREIPHVRIIRIGSKMPAFNPWRILDDPQLLSVLSRHSIPRRRIYMMAHFDHPRELTDPAINAMDSLIRAGVICANQCPLVRGINDDPLVLSRLFRELSWAGCPPYYLFQVRPTAGNRPYLVPIVRGWTVFHEALRLGSGLARRARYIMSHQTGKIEVLAVDDRHVYLRYLRSRDAALRGRFLICRRNDEACWFDDLQVLESAPVMGGGDFLEA